MRERNHRADMGSINGYLNLGTSASGVAVVTPGAGAGYAPQPISFDFSNNGTLLSDYNCVFGPVSGTWGLLTYLGVSDEYGNPLFAGYLDTPIAPVNGALVLVPPGTVGISFSSNLAATELTPNGFLLVLLDTTGWPTSGVGLGAGALFANGDLIGVVEGATPSPSAPPVYFGSITASQLLAFGGANLPVSDPGVLNQLWLNGDLVAISQGSFVRLVLNGVALMLTSAVGWPTSDTGLVAGDVWANGLYVNAVPGSTPAPITEPIYFGDITAAQFLALGASNLPVTDPQSFGQFWLNGVQVCVSQG